MIMPAISDSDLARLLSAGGHVPAMPASLADRIMAALPGSAAMAPLPPRTPRRTGPRHPRSRWLRGSIAVVAGLGLASAVAAGLARTPLLAPFLAPAVAEAMDGLAALTGLRARPPAPPQPPIRARLTPEPATPAAPARISSGLVAPLPVAPPSVSPPDMIMPHAMTPPRAAGLSARPERLPATVRPQQLPAAARPERPPAAARLRDQPGRRIEPDRLPLADRPMPERPLSERPATAPTLPDRAEMAPRAAAVAERVADRAADRMPDGPAVPAEPTASPAVAAAPPVPAEGAPGPAERPAAAAIKAEIATLREARQSGQITAEQSQRLRALQQMRSLRAARPPRDAARPRR